MQGNPSTSHYQNRRGNMNFGQQVIGGGNINVYHNQPALSVYDLLRPHFVPDALYNSTKRQAEHAVICQPDTQAKVLHDVRSWAASTTSTPICWLSGPAGTGKTTVAHTIAEEYDSGRLAATYFFWRKTGDRDDINKLAPTLAWQIAEKIQSAEMRMEKTLKDGSRILLSNLSFEDQLSKLLITKIKSTDPNLIIIDGLDECESQRGIYRLIEWIRSNKSPFRFLLTSRPEPEIKNCFAPRGNEQVDVQIFSLTESKADIQIYFIEQLEKVWPLQQRIVDRGPRHWPPEQDIETLVDQSEGLFVYAATAVGYIGGEGYPVKRLEDVLELHKGLDNLYRQVIEEATKWDNFDIVMGSLMYLRYPLNIDDLAEILLILNKHLTTPGILFALRRCYSIIAIPEDNSPIKMYHASLRDFLTDEPRSGPLVYSPTCHARLLFACLSAITRAFDDNIHAPEYALVSWYYHACSVLSAGVTGGRSEEIGDEGLVNKIDLKWIKFWMAESLQWAGLGYLNVEFVTKKDQAHTSWTRQLERKLRGISVILKNFQNYIKEHRRERRLRDDLLRHDRSLRHNLLLGDHNLLVNGFGLRDRGVLVVDQRARDLGRRVRDHSRRLCGVDLTIIATLRILSELYVIILDGSVEFT